MEYGMVAVPAAAVRRKPRHQTELTNQLLFGETVKIIKEKGSGWTKIRSLHDGYEGWVTRTLLTEIKEEEAKRYSDYITTGFFSELYLNEKKLQVPMGSSLPGFKEGQGEIGQQSYRLDEGFAKRNEQVPSAALVTQLTFQWLNAPYLWGGRTQFGVDCSGFVQVNYKMIGIDLPRDAWQQAQEGTTVRKLKEAITGDLAFFDDKDEIVHVGILLGEGRIIHSSGKVRIDEIDKKGIINTDTGKYSHDLRVIKRYW